MTPERALWTAVVIQALSDATGIERLPRDAARLWLLAGGRDFATVCGLAGIEASALRRYARALARRGWPRPEMFQEPPDVPAPAPRQSRGSVVERPPPLRQDIAYRPARHGDRR